jgi:hypothetical protein
MTDAYELVEQHWPYDGPHDDESLPSAAAAVERLTRYLANATRAPRLTWPGPSAYRTVSNLRGAMVHLDQVLEQLSLYASGPMAQSASLYDDRHDRPGADTALDVAVALECARDELRNAVEHLGRASRAGVHLGNDEAVAR